LLLSIAISPTGYLTYAHELQAGAAQTPSPYVAFVHGIALA
jgi:hypothetical protein